MFKKFVQSCKSNLEKIVEILSIVAILNSVEIFTTMKFMITRDSFVMEKLVVPILNYISY